MRRFLLRNRWVSVPVTLLLLFATSGMALSRMTCLAAGHTVLSLGSAADCCPEPADSDVPAFHPVCCDQAEARGAEAVGVAQGQLSLDAMMMLEAAPVMVLPIVEPARSCERSRHPAPPRSTPARLAVLGVFLI